jgi:PqqD family protein of HPr-rel-A system
MSKSFVMIDNLETTTLEEGAILFHAKSGKFIMLNRSAAVVWAELATPRTVEELVQKLAASFVDVAPDTAQQDVHELLAQLRELELVSSIEA